MSLDAMKQALSALEQYTNVVTSINDPNSWVTVADGGKPARDAISVLRAAIEQAQELVSSPPSRKPLTHPQIHELDWPDDVSFEDILLFARAVERAHGIKGEA